ncbi:AMP-binding protein [Brevibacterium marinum]|uniref:Long-chain-fatty-acid--CoA ligase n=1 Tax=Brevibacterium marinum TaxID=418643 RepID=A0A846S359_9MICO|nr:AMP-binding protein [Brevibacterium marinum]NJC58586.1 fatty-acyl-CoA synthase [Brevibacterium marinum]
MTSSDITLYGHLQEWAAAEPQRTALLDPVPASIEQTGLEHGHVRVTVTDLLTRADQFAALLAAHEVGDGDCVAVWLPSWADTYAWQFAASARGAHVIGVNTRYNVAEVGHVLTKARPRALVMAHGFRGLDFLSTATQAVAEAQAEAPVDSQQPFVPPVAFVWPVPGASDDPVATDYDLGSGAVTVPAETSPEAAAPPPAAPSADRLSVAFTTSGSTGMPKLAAHRESAVVSHSQHVAARVGYAPGDVLVEPLPYSGVFGYSAGMGALFGGAAVLLHPVFDEHELVSAWNAFGGTHFVGADDMLSRVRRVCEDTGTRLDSWKWAGVADFQGMSADIAHWAAESFGTRTVGVYGSSEVFALTAFWPTDTREELRYSGGGRLVDPAYDYRIVDPLSNEPVPSGSEGEVQLRGANVVDHYLGDTGEGAKNFAGNGWFSTGDLGRAQGPEAFEYVCRMGDVIRLRGFLVDPAEIEFHLITHDDVELVKVVARTDESGAPEVVAFVQPVPGSAPDPTEIRQYCKQRLASFKVPTEVRLVETMPVTAGTNGSKIKAAVLREWAAQPMEATEVLASRTSKENHHDT